MLISFFLLRAALLFGILVVVLATDFGLGVGVKGTRPSNGVRRGSRWLLKGRLPLLLFALFSLDDVNAVVWRVGVLKSLVVDADRATPTLSLALILALPLFIFIVGINVCNANENCKIKMDSRYFACLRQPGCEQNYAITPSRTILLYFAPSSCPMQWKMWLLLQCMELGGRSSKGGRPGVTAKMLLLVII